MFSFAKYAAKLQTQNCQLNRIMCNHILGYLSASSCGHINHHVIKIAVAAYFAGGFVAKAEFYAAAFVVDAFDASFYDEVVAHGEGTFIIYVGSAYYPAKTALHKFFHGHAVAAFHLIIPGGQYIIKIFAVVYVLKHVDIVGAYAKFGFEGGVDGSIHRANIIIGLESGW